MPTRDIKTRIVLEGEQEYKRAISDAAAANKVLNSELKLAKAQFEATGDAEEYAAEQARILKEKIAEQKKAVEAAEEAVRKLTEKGIDKNSTQMQNWKKKLNDAKASLYQMQSRLDKVGTELGQEQTEFDKTKQAGTEFDDKLQEIAKGVSFQNTITAIDGITGTIEKVIKAAARAAKAVWEMGVDAGQWADTIATESDKLGVDPETYQSWQYASRFIDTSVEDISRSWQDIQKNMKEGNLDYLAMLAEMGIASRDSSNHVRESGDIFWDAIDYLNGLTDSSKQAEEATKLFGNDWRKLNPLIKAGSKAYKDMAEEGKSVAVVSKENVKALAGVDDEVQKFQASFEKMKLDTLAALAPTFQTVAQALTQAVQAFDTFVQSEEGQQALAGLNEALQGIITSFLGEDNGQGTFKAIVEGAKGAVEGFTGAMGWISKNAGTVTDLVKGLGLAWGTLKVTEGVLQFMQLLKAIPLNKLTSIFGGGKAKADELPNGYKPFGNNSADAASKAAKESAERSAAAAESAGKASSDSSAASSGSADASGKASSKSAADSGKASSDAASKSASSSSGSAKSASDASSSSSKASSGSAKSASDASSSSSAASSGSAASAADASSSSSAASSASAAGASDAAITSAGASSQAALESGTASSQAAITSGNASSQAAITSGSASSQAAITSGNASSQAAITSGSASSQAAITSGSASSQAAITSGSASSASAASAAQAAITSAKASQAAAEAAAARSMLPSGSNLLGSGDSWIKKFLPSGISIRPTIGVGGGNTGGYLPSGPQFPALPSGTPTGSGLGGIGAKLSVPLSALEKALAMFSSTAAKVGGGLGLGLAMAFKETKTGNNDIWDELGNPTAEGLSAGITWRQEEQEKYNDQLQITQQKQEEILKLTEEQRAAAEAYWDRYRATDGDTDKDSEAAANLKKAFEGDLEGMDALIDMMDGRLDFYEKMNQEIPENLPDEWFSAGQNAAEKLEEAIAKATPEVITAGQDMGTAAVDAADKSLEAMKTAGDNASIGMAIGIDRSAHYAMEAAMRLAGAVAGCTQRYLAIQSPSKVMSRLGKFTSLGFAQGIESGAADVDRAVSHMLSATTRRPVTAMGGVPITGRTVAGSAAARAGSAAPDTVHVTLTMDDEVVGDIMAPIINAKIGAQIQATSRN